VLARPEWGLPRHIVFSDDAYLIPTSQSEIILETTVEFVGHDKRSTVSGVRTILSKTSEVVPSIGDGTLLRTWAGLRAYTPDELPLLGRHPALDGLILAAGHYPSGIPLGPITGQLVQEILTGTSLSIPLHPFRPDR
jgi:glycine oxidase